MAAAPGGGVVGGLLGRGRNGFPALHAVDVARPDATHARVHLRAQDDIPNRDFVLRWAVAGDHVRSAVLTHRSPDGDGYVILAGGTVAEQVATATGGKLSSACTAG